MDITEGHYDMRRSAIVLLAFLTLLLTAVAPLFAQDGSDALASPVILSEHQDRYPLGLHLDILEDPGGELTIADVTSPEYDAQFSRSRGEVPSFGFTNSAYWVRLRLRNESASTENWLLAVDFENTHFVDFYDPLASGDGFEVIRTGTMRPPSTRDIPYPRLVFEVTPPDQSEQTYYLRFENGAPMVLALTLWQPAAFFAQSLRLRLPELLFYGIMIGLLVYNLFLSASLRDANYLYLAAMLASAIVYEVSQTSLLEIYVLPTFYQYRVQIIGLSSAMILVSLILFFNSFLGAKTNAPHFYQINRLLMGFALMLGLATFVFNYHQVAVILAPTVALVCGFNMLVVLVARRRGFQGARILLWAMMGLLACLMIFILARLNVIPISAFTEHAFRLGFVWMAIGSSLALADRINVLKTETEQSNRELRLSEQRLAQTLEAMPVGVVVYGPDQKPSFINRRTAEILTNPERGIGPHPNLDRTVSEAMAHYAFRVSGTDQAYPLERFPAYRALMGEPTHADDIEADLIDRRVQLEAWASPVFDESGAVETAVIAFQDVSRRKQAEEALKASEKKFRAIAENVFDGIGFLGRDRTILYVSPSYEKLNGLPAEEMVGKSGVGTVHPDDRDYVAATFQTLLEQPGKTVREEYRIKHKDGSWVWVETRVKNLLDDPHVQAVVLNSRDITERKKQDAELAAYREHLEQLVEERTADLNVINEQLAEEVAERMALEGLLHKRIEWMSIVGSIRQRIGGTADLQGAYEELSETIRRLLDAGSVFLICWSGEDEPGDFLCRFIHQGRAPDTEGIRTAFPKDSPLRRDIEQGVPQVIAADEIAVLPAPLQTCLAGNGARALLLMPMHSGADVRGVLGMTVPNYAQSYAEAQAELVAKFAFDLASLNEYATFLDQSRALAAGEERNRLARDLHDSVTQVLFSASLVAEVLPQIWKRDPEKGMKSLAELRRLTRGALAEMRTMLLELRPAAVFKSPLHELLPQLTEATTSRTDLSFRLFVEQVPPLPPPVHAAFYRVAQEALNNVAKHARASQVTMSLNARRLPAKQGGEQAIEITLVVQDDGTGFALGDEGVGHLGIGIMRERAADVGAILNITSQSGQGAQVSLTWCGVPENGT